MAQNITLLGASYSAVPAVTLPKTGGGTAKFTDVTETTASASDVAQNKVFFDANGTKQTGSASGGSSMNVQVKTNYKSSRSTSYTDIGLSITCKQAGTYSISWMGWRTTNSGTSGTQLYKNGSALGSAHTAFTGTYGQHVTETGIQLNKNDVVSIYARARSNSYYMYVGNLILEQTS